MKENDLDILVSILNTYKFPFKVRDKGNIIQLGGVEDLRFLTIYNILIPLGIGSSIILISFLIGFPFFSYFSVLFFLFGIYGIVVVLLKKKSNRSKITFDENGFSCIDNSTEIQLTPGEIGQFTYAISEIDSDQYEGKLILSIKKSKTLDIMSLYSSDRQALEDDISYVTNFFNEW